MYKRSIQELREEWWSFFHEELERQRKANAPMVWQLENCYNDEKSAGSTLAGIRINKISEGTNEKFTVSYDILGDSCFIVVKNNQVTEQFSSNPNEIEFGNYPDYIDSNNKIGQKGSPMSGEILVSDFDKLFLVTDALSKKFDKERNESDKGQSFIEQINKITNHDEFEIWVDTLRKDGLSDDDTTLVCLEWGEGEEFEIVYQTPLSDYIKKEHLAMKEDFTSRKNKDEVPYLSNKPKDEEDNDSDSKEHSQEDKLFLNNPPVVLKN